MLAALVVVTVVAVDAADAAATATVVVAVVAPVVHTGIAQHHRQHPAENSTFWSHSQPEECL